MISACIKSTSCRAPGHGNEQRPRRFSFFPTVVERWSVDAAAFSAAKPASHFTTPFPSSVAWRHRHAGVIRCVAFVSVFEHDHPYNRGQRTATDCRPPGVRRAWSAISVSRCCFRPLIFVLPYRVAGLLWGSHIGGEMIKRVCPGSPAHTRRMVIAVSTIGASNRTFQDVLGNDLIFHKEDSFRQP